MPDEKHLDLESLKEVIKIMKENDLTEICIEQDGVKIEVKRGYTHLAPVEYSTSVPIAHERLVAHPSESGVQANDLMTISAPMVGTFYRAPSPDAEPFVEVGDQIKAGQVICVIEAMKLMNEITADLDCEIVDILLKNGQPVEYQQPIFRVRPG